MLPEVPTGLPAALLERRPDLRQAESTLIGANARAIRVAEDRKLFAEAMEKIGLKVPKSGIARSMDDVRRIEAGETLPWMMLDDLHMLALKGLLGQFLNGTPRKALVGAARSHFGADAPVLHCWQGSGRCARGAGLVTLSPRYGAGAALE